GVSWVESQKMNLTFTGFTTTSVTINWTKPDGGVDWYIIRWNGGQQVSSRTNETFFTIQGLTPGTQYNITVAAAAVQERGVSRPALCERGSSAATAEY
uniref:Fibronectin type-III domain-containing protein n=1 Tax=Oreochromis aureus TaxID=47969 RepID=A0A668VWB4_OREAU